MNVNYKLSTVKNELIVDLNSEVFNDEGIFHNSLQELTRQSAKQIYPNDNQNNVLIGGKSKKGKKGKKMKKKTKL